MRKIKAKKQNNKQSINRGYIDYDNQNQVKWLLIISLIVVVIFMSFYFLTKLIIERRNSSNNTNNINSLIKTEDETILFSQLLKQDDDEYYVFAELPNDPLTNSYSSGLIGYTQSEDSLPVYYIDMAKAMNKQAISSDTQIVDDVRDIKIANTTLFHILDGEIADYYIGSNAILEQINLLNQ